MRLKVTNFASLSSIDIDFNDYTILIGEQASGKSVSCKLYFFLRDTISTRLVSSVIEKESWKFFCGQIKEDFYAIFPEYSWREKDFVISLSKNVKSAESIVEIAYKAGSRSPSFKFSKEFVSAYKGLRSKYEKIMRQMAREQSARPDDFSYFDRELSAMSAFRKAFRDIGFDDFVEDVTYIPSGRAFFSVIRDNVFGFLSENIGIDPFIKSFGKFYEFAKRVNTNRRIGHKKAALDTFDSISKKVLKGSYKLEKNEGWLVSDMGRVLVSNASSGQQEALPLLLGLRALILSHPGFGRRSVVVEEPEAHLFPSSQKSIVELIFLVNSLGAKSKFIITTHSPYVLACANNEMLKMSGSEFSKSAYYISNGRSYNIIDKQTGLLVGDQLDKVSEEIAHEFYKILEVSA